MQAAFGPGAGPEYGAVSDLVPIFSTAPSRLLRVGQSPKLQTDYWGADAEKETTQKKKPTVWGSREVLRRVLILPQYPILEA